MRVYVPRFLSRHNKDLERRTLKPPWRVTALGSWIDCVITLMSQKDCVISLRSWKDRVIALRQISVTAQCYSSILFRRQQENPSSRHEGTWFQRREEKTSQHAGERERASFGSSFYVFFSLCLSYVNWASQECCLFYLRSSLRSSDLLLFYFLGLFPCLLATAVLDSFSLFYLPNIFKALSLPSCQLIIKTLRAFE